MSENRASEGTPSPIENLLERRAKAATAAKAVDVGDPCKCGHGLYEHYMCGAPNEARCYKRADCGCQQFNPR